MGGQVDRPVPGDGDRRGKQRLLWRIRTVRQDQGQVQIVDISNVPFARADLEWIAKGIGFRRGPMKDTPVNGTYA